MAKHIITAIALVAAASVFTGCSSISQRSHPYLGANTYPPSDPSQIKILNDDPGESEERLGEIVLGVQGDAAREKLESKLKQAASKFGANAVVIVYDKTHLFPTVYGSNWGPIRVTESAKRDIVAVAIKSRGPQKPDREPQDSDFEPIPEKRAEGGAPQQDPDFGPVPEKSARGGASQP